MKFFIPEDFSNHLKCSWPAEEMAKLCNEKLEREGKVIYGIDEKDWHIKEPYIKSTGEKLTTHKALLINIEAIEKCKHPIESIKANDPNIIHGFICSNCGAKVKPTSFEEV